LLPGLHAEASYGEYHRTPSFLELFGDSGSVAGSTDLTPEEGTNRDVGLEWATSFAGYRLHTEAAHFHNRVDHLIVFLPQSQRTFVARNIGSARMQGEELSWSLRTPGTRIWASLQGNLTLQRTEDLGVDRTWYAGNTLPGRPQRQLFTRLRLSWGRVEAAWQFEHLGGNYLDQANLESVPQRDRHGLDLTVDLRGMRLRGSVRNLTDNKDVDVRRSPLPGRTWSLMSEMGF
jgi:outer membrane cobalamin receptor